MRKVIRKICRVIFALWFGTILLFIITVPTLGITQIATAGMIFMQVVAMIASLFYWAVGGSSTWKAATNVLETTPENSFSNAFYRIVTYFWRILDNVEGACWYLFDSWRKPAVEFHTKCSRLECIARLNEVTDDDEIIVKNMGDLPISSWLMENHFYLFRQHTWPIARRGAGLALFGKLSKTTRGTYVRAWYRPSLIALLIMGLFFVLLAFVLVQIVPAYLEAQLEWDSFTSKLIGVACGFSVPVFLYCFLVWISTSIGKRKEAVLVEFLESILNSSWKKPANHRLHTDFWGFSR